MGECAQKGLEWFIVLQAAEHRSENQHDRKRRAVLSEVEALKSYFADAINAKPSNYMNNVMGFLEPVNHEFVCAGYWRGSIRVSGVIETLLNAIIDWLKIRDRFSLVLDQNLHLFCKLAWVVLLIKF